MAGGTPRFADVDQFSFCITKETVKRVITRRTKAILPVHLFGGIADVQGLKAFGLPVIEDACQAVGARVSSGYSGSLGLAGAYSFNGGKNIPAGESGCLVTNSSDMAERARLLMNHGENFGQAEIGLNYRPNELTCCVAYHGLLELEERNEQRRKLVDIVSPCSNGLWVAPDHHYRNKRGEREAHVYYVVPAVLTVGIDRSKFIKRMAKHGIPVGAGYISPVLSHYKAFRKYARGPLPVVEELSSKTLCILSTLTPDRPLSYAEKVAKAMRESLS
jgi:dTDP-4-amino-4,6-dideoxygalactose transaminase